MTTMERERWKEVTPDNPCEVCGVGTWCRRSPDGSKVACRRETRGAAKTKRYKDGSDAYLHILQPSGAVSGDGKPKRRPRPSGLTPTAADAPILQNIATPTGDAQDAAAKRDAAYRRLLTLLPLSPDHHENLRRRGLSDSDIDAGFYRTLPTNGRQSVVKTLAAELGQDFAAVPGFVTTEHGPRIAAPSGLLVPVRDLTGRVVALKLRADKPTDDRGRYCYLSSAKYGGPSPGSPAHVPLHGGRTTTTTNGVASVAPDAAPVRITEGELKADVATALSGILTVSFPGVSSWRVILPVLQDLQVKTVRVAFDQDASTNKHVAKALLECAQELQTHGYAVELERWPFGHKGIDDLLAAGGTPEVITGDAALEAARSIAAAAGVDDSGGDADGERERPKSQATLLVALAAAGELWHTVGQAAAYTTLPVAEHREHWPVCSLTYRRWLARQFFAKYGKAPGGQALQDGLGVIEGQAFFGGQEYPVAIRVAGHADKLYLDLANGSWQAAEIDAAGWRVVEVCPVRFRRAKAMLALPTPTAGGDIGELRRFVNVSDDGWPLMLAWLVAAFRPTGPYPLLALHGEQGSAKSTTARTLRVIVDPNAAPVRCEPKEPRDLMIAANNGWVIALDNLSYVHGWLSDALCRLSTGGGFATRTLYENDEETIFDAMRPVILTGIEELANRSDLLDRSLIEQLPRIPEARRRTEAEHWREFQQAHGRILGAVLDGVSAAMRNLPTTHIDRLPRMADFALWATAAEPGLGLQPGEFLTAYRDNRDTANEAALDTSPVAKHVLAVAESGGWDGTPSDLLELIESVASDGDKRLKTWPKNPRSLSGILKRLAPNLRAAGVEVEFGRAPDRQRRRFVTVFRTEGDSCGCCVHTVRDTGKDGVSADASDANSPGSDAKSDANGIDANASGATVRTQTDGSDAKEPPYPNRERVSL